MPAARRTLLAKTKVHRVPDAGPPAIGENCEYAQRMASSFCFFRALWRDPDDFTRSCGDEGAERQSRKREGL